MKITGAAPAPRGSSGMIVTNHSGGENQQLDPSSFDARTREIASPTGGTVTAKMLKRPGSHVPRMKPEKATPHSYYEPVAEYSRSDKLRSY